MYKGLLILIPLVMLAFFTYRSNRPGVKSASSISSPTPFLTPSADHQANHYPSVYGERVQPVPYLKLPFLSTDSSARAYDITEGWYYSEAELAIHNADPVHHGVDLAVPYGTEVVSPVDGYAIASYYAYKVKNPDGSYRLYKDRYIWMGLGYFVRIYVPKVNRFVTIGHLANLDEQIKFSPPLWAAAQEMWVPANQTLSVDQWKNSPDVTFVTTGTPLGKVGYSGLGWGYDDYQPGLMRPLVIDPKTQVSWDEPHIHLEEFWFDQENHKVHLQRDMYGIYGLGEAYPTAKRKRLFGKDTLFFLNDQGLPKFADER